VKPAASEDIFESIVPVSTMNTRNIKRERLPISQAESPDVQPMGKYLPDGDLVVFRLNVSIHGKG